MEDGVLAAGREVVRLAEDSAWLAAAGARIHFADAQGVALIADLENGFLLGFAALLALTFLARRGRVGRLAVLVVAEARTLPETPGRA